MQKTHLKGAEGRRATRTIKRIDSRLNAMKGEYKRVTGLDYLTLEQLFDSTC